MVFMTILHTAARGQLSSLNQNTRKQTGPQSGRAPSLLVIDATHRRTVERQRTTAPHGLSHHELPWHTEGMRYLRRQGPAAHVTVEPIDGLPERAQRKLFREVKNRLALFQRREKMRRVLIHEVLESDPSPHSHIVAAMPDREAWKRLTECFYNAAFYRHVLVEDVWDWDGLTTYLAGEATPQAWKKAGRSFPRVKGPHPLGEGGGDRVRQSKDLEDALLRSGRVMPRLRTYAARSLPPVHVAPILLDLSAGLFGTALPITPPPRRLLVPVKREKLIVPDQMTLGLDTQPDVIDIMMGLAPTHAGIAQHLGLSRQQTTAIINRQFGASRPVVRRVLELARAA